MGQKVIIVLALALVLILARMSLFTVDRTEFVYVTQLGRHVATYDGASDEEAGLHLRWPWPIQSLTSVDRRLQVLDLPAAELVTEDPSETGTVDRTVTVDAYLIWRVADAASAERFIRVVGSPERAREILRDRMRGRLGAGIARKKFPDLVSTRPDHIDAQRELLRRELLAAADRADGIDVVDVRVRRINYPPQVRQSIFDRIRSERNRKAETARSRGRTEAENIKSESEAKVTVQLAEAQARNDAKRGRADAQADRILNSAISKDPDYYAELRRREVGDIAFEGGKVKVWSTQLFKLLFPGVPTEGMKREGGR